MSKIKQDMPDVKYDSDKAIDNKSIIQASSIIERMKRKIVDDKEVS